MRHATFDVYRRVLTVIYSERVCIGSGDFRDGSDALCTIFNPIASENLLQLTSACSFSLSSHCSAGRLGRFAYAFSGEHEFEPVNAASFVNCHFIPLLSLFCCSFSAFLPLRHSPWLPLLWLHWLSSQPWQLDMLDKWGERHEFCTSVLPCCKKS
jgi:hypothetical protein